MINGLDSVTPIGSMKGTFIAISQSKGPKCHLFLTSYYHHLVVLQVSSLPATSALPSCAPISDHARGQAQPSITQTSLSATIDIHSVFNVLNIFRACWFLNCDHLLSLVVFAKKSDVGNKISWVEFTPQALFFFFGIQCLYSTAFTTRVAN